MKMADVGCGYKIYSTFMEEYSIFMEEYSIFMEEQFIFIFRPLNPLDP